MKKNILLSLCLSPLALIGQDTSSAFSDLVENEDGSYTNWIGTIEPLSGTVELPAFYDHEQHGVLYVDAAGQNVFLWDENLSANSPAFTGWLYTSRDVFPLFYAFGDSAQWIGYLPGVMGPAPTPRVFFSVENPGSIYLPKAQTMDIVETAVGAGSFETLATALTTASLIETLQGDGPFTVFAPTDDAFGAVNQDLLGGLLADVPALTEVLTYHVVPGRLSASDLGLDVENLFSGEALSYYVTTVAGIDLRVDITPFGVLLDGIAMVTTPNIETSNGLIHVIDTVLLPPADLAATAVEGGLNTLVTALTQADLAETIATGGPFTVFAPIDSAFAALGTETLNSLLEDANKAQLQNILTYHVVEGIVYSEDVKLGEVTMLNGDTATIDMDAEGNLTIDGAAIIETDIRAKNGVVHLIDSVILPPAE